MIQIQNAYTKYDELYIKSHELYILSAIKCGKDWSILTYYWENSRLKKEFEGSEHICKWARSEGDQPWDFFGRNDAEAETPVLWPPHAKSWLIGTSVVSDSLQHMDCGPPGSSVHGIFQARTMEWVAMPFSRGFFSHIAGIFFTVGPPGKINWSGDLAKCRSWFSHSREEPEILKC